MLSSYMFNVPPRFTVKPPVIRTLSGAESLRRPVDVTLTLLTVRLVRPWTKTLSETVWFVYVSTLSTGATAMILEADSNIMAKAVIFFIFVFIFRQKFQKHFFTCAIIR